MADLDFLVTPYNTTEFAALVTEAIKMHQDMHSRDRVIAAELRKLLANPKGTKLAAMRMDMKMNAYRVARHFVGAGAANLAAGRAYRVAYTTYLDLYTGAPSHGSGRQFNVN